MKKIYSLTLLSLFSISLVAQNDNDITNLRVRQTLGQKAVTPQAGGMRTLPLKPAETEGDHFLMEDMVTTNFILLGDEIYEGYQARYNLKGNFFAVEYEDEVKYLEGDLLKAFTYVDPNNGKQRVFINRKVMPKSPELLKGFWEIHHNGEKIKLVSRKESRLIEANYNVALDVGERNNRIKLDEFYYIFENNEYKPLRKLKKKDLAIFGERKEDMSDYIKKNNVNIENEDQLISLIQHYEQLASG
ncbi:MAG: hypothetical protein RJQ09_09995 [Cyclobacteriaceae bacterium]